MTQLTLCPRCGEENDSKQSYCRPCMSAYKKARRDVRQPVVECVVCGVCFRKTRSRMILCSEACAVKRARALRGSSDWYEQTCTKCGADTSGPRPRRFCSKKCFRKPNSPEVTARRNRKLREQRLAAVRAAGVARTVPSRQTIRARPSWVAPGNISINRWRGRQYGVVVHYFDVAALEARMSMFGFCCWMCGGEAVAMDHVKPFRAGGPHCLSNLRPACKSCNSSKGARWYGVYKMSLFMRA